MKIKSAAVISALLFAATFSLGAVPLNAKPLSRMLAQSPFQPGDFDVMRAAEMALYDTAGVKAGSSVKWSNPETSAHGRVKVTGRSGNCLALGHVAYPGGATQAKQIARKFCKSSDGKWLLAE